MLKTYFTVSPHFYVLFTKPSYGNRICFAEITTELLMLQPEKVFLHQLTQRKWPLKSQPPYGAPAPMQYPGQPGYGAPGQYPPPQPGIGLPGQPYGGPPMGGPPPGVDPQVYQWFTTVDTDKSGQITAIELQQALVNANWSHFNAETTRLMIGMFDRDYSGTINLHEFAALWNYIQQWKGVFEQTDLNRTGSIEAHELSGALQRMGYTVSPQFTNMVVCRFDTMARRHLTLDNFIQVCVMLKTLTDNFMGRDPQRVGSIRLSYEDFMCMAVANKP